MQHKIDEISNALKSQDWSQRSWGQSQLESLTNSRQWRRLFKGFEYPPDTLLNLLLRQLTIIIKTVSIEEYHAFFHLVLSSISPLRQSDRHCREFIESFLSVETIDYQYKVEALLARLNLEIKDDVYHKSVLLPVIRALALLQAKAATTSLVPFLYHEDSQIAHETVRALQLIRDPKAAPYLEKIFGLPNVELASAAITAYSQLVGKTLFSNLRLYRIYLCSDLTRRSSVLAALMKMQISITPWLLRHLYGLEKDVDLRDELLKYFAKFSNQSTTRLLMVTAACEAIPRLKLTARASLECISALTMAKTIEWALKSPNPKIMKRGILKASQLSAVQALRILKPYLKGETRLSPILRIALVETVGKLPDAPWVTAWLAKRLVSKGRLKKRAIAGLLRRSSPPVLDILNALEKGDTESLRSFLTVLISKTALIFPMELKSKLLTYLHHEAGVMRFLSAQILLSFETRDFFQAVWLQSLVEIREERESFVELLADALSNGRNEWDWIPIDWPEHDFSGDLKRVFLREVVERLNTVRWDLKLWQQLLQKAVSGIHPESDSTEMQRNFSSQETGGDILLEFLKKQPHFLKEIRDLLLEQESNSEVLRVLASTVSEVYPVRYSTLAKLSERLEMSEGVEEQAILDCLSRSRNQQLYSGFINWLAALEPGLKKERAFAALAIWLQNLTIIPQSQRRTAVG